MILRKNYYCLVAGLPDLVFDESKIETSLLEFKEDLKNELLPDDYKLVELIFLAYDNRNILGYLGDESFEFDKLGNITLEDIDNILVYGSSQIPGYIIDFIEKYKEGQTGGPEFDWEKYLLLEAYKYLSQSKNMFVREWSEFDLNIRNIMAALNCRVHGLDISSEVVPANELAENLLKNTNRDFGLAGEFDYIDSLIQIHEEPDLLEREKKLDLLRWEYIEDKTFFHYFTVEKVIGFLIKFMIVTRWLKLDRETGMKMFRDMIEEFKNSYEFPEEFK